MILCHSEARGIFGLHCGGRVCSVGLFSLHKKERVHFLGRTVFIGIKVVYVFTTDPSCLRMIPPFVGTGRAKE
jgi:hypothetical protein